MRFGPTEATGNCQVVLTKIRRAGDAGVRIHGNFNVFDTCQILQAGGIGLLTTALPASTSNDFITMKVVEPASHGFLLQGLDNELRECKVVRAGGHGVQLSEGEGNNVGGCSFTKPALDGVFAEASSLAAFVVACKISKPGANGIAIEGDGAVIQDSTTKSAGDDGYAVLGSGGTWTGNAATGSASDAFEVSGTNNTLSFNKAKGSKEGFDLNVVAGGPNDIDETNSFKTQSP